MNAQDRRQEDILRHGATYGTPLFDGRPERVPTTETRDQAYSQALKDGRIRNHKEAVLGILRQTTHDMTATEIAKALGLPINVITGPVGQLRDAEPPMILATRTRRCNITGHNATAYIAHHKPQGGRP